ncbi:MAG: hypothetical protein AAGK37_21900 [Pseudomonadota bacterium]
MAGRGKHSVEETKKRIASQFDPIGFFGRIMRGEPVEIRSLDGEVIGYDKPDLPMRIACARELVKRSHPELAAAREDGTVPDVQVIFQTPVPLPPKAQALQLPEILEADDG